MQRFDTKHGLNGLVEQSWSVGSPIIEHNSTENLKIRTNSYIIGINA